MLNWRRIALDINFITRRLARFFGAISLRSEQWYYSLTEKERK